jgi:hypothetical protein
MFDILSIIPGKKRRTHGGWVSFNGICCHHQGHRPDARMRGGIHIDGNNWSYHCFNCNFKCGFTLGKSIGYKVRQLLSWCGIDEKDILRWNLESLQQKDFLDFTKPAVRVNVNFEIKQLPDDCEDLNLDDARHFRYIEYIERRGIHYNSYPFKVTPIGTGNPVSRREHRIIIPYYFKGDIVGYTSRFLDDKLPKYINVQQQGYVFNIDAQKEDWSVCLVTEGIFDALSVDGVALMHDDISPEQAILLSTLNRQIIVVPDRDATGLKLCDKALELGYQVSLPDWEAGIKDVNDAIKKYGRLPTLLSILQSATNSKIKLEIQRKKIGKQKGF